MCSEYEITMYSNELKTWATESQAASFLIQKHACVEQIDNHTPEICICRIYLSCYLTIEERKKRTQHQQKSDTHIREKMNHPIWGWHAFIRSFTNLIGKYVVQHSQIGKWYFARNQLKTNATPLSPITNDVDDDDTVGQTNMKKATHSRTLASNKMNARVVC